MRACRGEGKTTVWTIMSVEAVAVAITVGDQGRSVMRWREGSREIDMVNESDRARRSTSSRVEAQQTWQLNSRFEGMNDGG